jgi:hypothetical protein
VISPGIHLSGAFDENVVLSEATPVMPPWDDDIPQEAKCGAPEFRESSFAKAS